jgi:hypothetical protein
MCRSAYLLGNDGISGCPMSGLISTTLRASRLFYSKGTWQYAHSDALMSVNLGPNTFYYTSSRLAVDVQKRRAWSFLMATNPDETTSFVVSQYAFPTNSGMCLPKCEHTMQVVISFSIVGKCFCR